MRFKKVLISVILLSLWGGSMIFADTVSQRIKVSVNGSTLSETGIVVDGTTFLPIRQLADTLNAFISWGDNKQVNINKPNIHMMTMSVNSSGVYPFQAVEKGSTVTFYVLVHGDSLNTPISAAKMEIVDPGNTAKEFYYESNPENLSIFQLRTKELKYKFGSEGEYKVRMYMMPGKSSEWTLVSEKLIFSK
ncbi:MAG: copper amine oxidase [Thermobacillus sp.]|uniref:stalk domain-containing protein n=1 Tax=Thermobacillus sp. TaxID=2108467 RepID=UPI000E39C5B0|nr:copper amine oxidase [Thermobacillus sp.]REK58478.1 MAG: copper amine oxidase [Thermobacillus sp.]